MIRITLQGIPPSLNQFAGRENTQAYRKAKKEWSETVAWMCKMAGLPPAPYQRAEVRIYYHFPDRRRRDPDNYSGKMLTDGLTRGGVIVDDSFQHIRLVLDGWYDPAWTGTEIQMVEIT